MKPAAWRQLVTYCLKCLFYFSISRVHRRLAAAWPPGAYCCLTAVPLPRRCTHRQVTPFLLERIRALTGGKSLDSNIKLVKNNARVRGWMLLAAVPNTGPLLTW